MVNIYKLRLTNLQEAILRLLFIRLGNKLNQREIAKKINVSAPAVMKALPLLEKEELIILKKSGKKITFGLYGNSNTNFNTNSTQVIRRINFDYSTSSSNFHSDTLFKERQSGVKASGKLPAEICFGAMFEKENKLRFGFNINSGFWKNYQNEIKPEILENTFSVSSGIEWTPEYNSYNKYLKRVRYRGGVHYGSDPRLIKGEQIKTTGFTFGLGLPLVMPRQQVSFVDITFDIGKTGVSVLSENYAKVILGFTLNDNSWFYKRRFN